jgi:hypothetical protein
MAKSLELAKTAISDPIANAIMVLLEMCILPCQSNSATGKVMGPVWGL